MSPERTATEMASTYLIQRLRAPAKTGGLGGDNPFSFGGGLRNGGLSEDAMGRLRGVFSFDYMGAAEFEFGAVPEALERMAGSADTLCASSFTIPLRKIAANWRASDTSAPTGEARIYVLCQRTHLPEVEARIRADAAGKGGRLKEGTRLSAALRPAEEWDNDVCGWLELDNGFFFFTDETMWTGVAALFGVETSPTGGTDTDAAGNE